MTPLVMASASVSSSQIVADLINAPNIHIDQQDVSVYYQVFYQFSLNEQDGS